MSRIKILSSPDTAGTDEAVTWRLSGKVESQITTLAAWCQVRQQQQKPLEPQASSEDEDSESDDAEEVLTVIGAPLTTLDVTPIKRAFLDALAEIVCRQKHASFVTCTYLSEQDDDRCHIYIARNAAWTADDTKYLEYLARYLAGIEIDKGTFLVKASGYYASRVRYHAKQALKDMLIKPETDFLVKELQDCASGTVLPSSIVRTVDALLKSPHFEWFSRIATTTNRSEQFHRELQFLHRPEIAHSIFCHTASQLSSFKNVQFTLLPGFAPRRVPINIPLRVASSMKP
jgi:hypothetical protein